MNDVSCSDGVNGLTTRYGWTTQGAIPKFPYIGGAELIAGWNSANVSYPSRLASTLPSRASFRAVATVPSSQ